MSNDKIETFCLDRRLLLKIKLKSLAEESKIIREEERKLSRSRPHLLGMMHHHRVVELRQAIRSTHIAYGLVKGHSYLDIEKKAYIEPDWKSIEKMIFTYQKKFDKVKLASVIEEAKVAFKSQFDSHELKTEAVMVR